jgi:DnaK suppressor protein
MTNNNEIKLKIEQKITELNARIESRKELLTLGKGETSADDIGTAFEMQNNSRNQSDQDRVMLNQLKKALVRISSDDYGYCETCSEDIHLGRLLAYPAASRCIDCQTLSDRRAA